MKKILLAAALMTMACAGPREYVVPIHVYVCDSNNNRIEIRLQVKADVPQNYDVKPDISIPLPVLP